MRDAFIARLTDIAMADPRVVLLTGDLGFKVLDDYRRLLPRQFLNVGVAEQNLAAIGTGMALEGHIAFTYSIGNFPTLRCLEQLRNDACYHAANLKVVSVGGGFSYGALGFSHHATEDLSIVRSLPGMTVVAPADLWETEEATRTLAATEGCAYLRLDKSDAGRTNRPGEEFHIGRARMLRSGDAVTLIGCGGLVAEALVATDALAAQGIACRVLSHHTLSQIDDEAIHAAARETGGIITIEEHSIVGGLGGAIAEFCLESNMRPRRFKRLGLRHEFATVVGSQAYLREHYGMDSSAIIKVVREFVGAD